MKAYQAIIKENIIKSKNISPLEDSSIKRCICKEISREEAKMIIMQYEWLGTFGIAKYYFGMYIDNMLVCVVCYGQTGARKNKYLSYVGDKYVNNGIQLVRGASTAYAPHHASSKLISFSLKEMSKKGYKYVVAFSDPLAGEIGTVYQATNWYFTGNSVDSKGKDRVHYNMIIDGRKYHLRSVVSKFGTSKKNILLGMGHNVEYEKLEAKGRYFYLLGTKRQKKEMIELLNKFIRSYPKRN